MEWQTLQLANPLPSSDIRRCIEYQLSAMDWIKAEKFLELWARLKRETHKTDTGLARAIGVSPSRITRYKSGESAEVNPDVLAQIERELGYEIALTEDGEWEVRRVTGGTASKEEHYIIETPSRKSPDLIPPPVFSNHPLADYTNDDLARIFGKYVRLTKAQRTIVEDIIDQYLKG